MTRHVYSFGPVFITSIIFFLCPITKAQDTRSRPTGSIRLRFHRFGDAGVPLPTFMRQESTGSQRPRLRRRGRKRCGGHYSRRLAGYRLVRPLGLLSGQRDEQSGIQIRSRPHHQPGPACLGAMVCRDVRGANRSRYRGARRAADLCRAGRHDDPDPRQAPGRGSCAGPPTMGGARIISGFCTRAISPRSVPSCARRAPTFRSN